MALPPPMSVTVLVIGLIVVAAASFAALTTFERRETVQGLITPQGGLVKVVARNGGLIERIDIKEGVFVAAGQPMAALRLSNETATGDSGAAFAQDLAHERRAAAARGLAEVDDLRGQAARLRARRAIVDAEAPLLTQRIARHEERLKLARGEVERAEKLADSGYLPRRELVSRREAALAAEDDLTSSRSAMFASQREGNAIDAELESLDLRVARAQAASAAEAAVLNQRRTEADARSAYVVTSPVAGRVATLPVFRGSTVEEGATVAVVVPANSQLEAELYVPSRAAGLLEIGQPVRLMYQAFPYQRFGAGRGAISAISSTVLSPAEAGANGLELKEPVFRVRVRLNDEAVAAYGRRYPLRPGMLLDADVVLDRRSLFEWLLDPVFAAGRRR